MSEVELDLKKKEKRMMQQKQRCNTIFYTIFLSGIKKSKKKV